MAGARVPALAGPKSMVMKDRVAATQVSRYWPMPGLLDRQLVALDVGGSVLGGLASSRLDEVMVRNEKIATSVSAGLYAFQRVGVFFEQNGGGLVNDEGTEATANSPSEKDPASACGRRVGANERARGETRPCARAPRALP